jgi:hypothetical protein
MGATDRPSATDVAAAAEQQAGKDRQIARTKLLALAAALAGLGFNHRMLDNSYPRPLLRVWDPHRQALGETIACLPSEVGWEFLLHPFGPTIGPATSVEEPGDAIEVARVMAHRLTSTSRM